MTKYFFLSILFSFDACESGAYGSGSPKSQNLESSSSGPKTHDFSEALALLSLNNENAFEEHHNPDLAIHESQEKSTSKNPMRLTPISLIFRYNFKPLARFLSPESLASIAILSKDLFNGVSYCMEHRANHNFVQLKEKMNQGRLNLFWSPIPAEKHLYYPCAHLLAKDDRTVFMTTNGARHPGWIQFYQGIDPEFLRCELRQIFKNPQKSGKALYRGESFTGEYQNNNVINEIAIEHPMALCLGKMGYQEMIALKSTSEQQATSEKQRTELWKDPLYHYDKILKLRKTPLLIEDLTLLRHDPDLLAQVVRCQINFSKVKQEDYGWLLETISAYDIQISAILNNELSPDRCPKSVLFGKEQKTETCFNDKCKSFITSIFLTGLVSELEFRYHFNDNFNRSMYEKTLQSIPHLDKVKSLLVRLGGYLTPDQERKNILLLFTLMPKLRHLFYHNRVQPVSLPRGDFKGHFQFPELLAHLETAMIQEVGFYVEQAQLPKSLKHFACSNTSSKDRIFALEHFDSLKSFETSIPLASMHNSEFKAFMPALLKHKELEHVYIELDNNRLIPRIFFYQFSSFSDPNPKESDCVKLENCDYLENTKTFLNHLASFRSLKEITLKIDSRLKILNRTFFQNIRNHPCLKRIFLDVNSYLFYSLESNYGDLISIVNCVKDALCSLNPLEKNQSQIKLMLMIPNPFFSEEWSPHLKRFWKDLVWHLKKAGCALHQVQLSSYDLSGTLKEFDY